MSQTNAATSYLLIQGPFGTGGATVTKQWKFVYSPGALTYGQDLLDAVFGTPSPSDSYTGAFGTYDSLVAGNASQGVRYIDYGGGSYFPISFTLNGVPVQQSASYDPSWTYYVAGGPDSYIHNTYPGSNYPTGTWSYSDDGTTTRELVDGSFDGWVFGNSQPLLDSLGDPILDDFGFPVFSAPTITGAENAPIVMNFNAAGTLVSAAGGVSVYALQTAPEPGRALLLLVGLGTVILRRRRLAGISQNRTRP